MGVLYCIFCIMLNERLVDIYRQIAYDDSKKPADRVKACKGLYKHSPEEKNSICDVLTMLCDIEESPDAVKILALDLLDSINTLVPEEKVEEDTETIQKRLLEKYLG